MPQIGFRPNAFFFRFKFYTDWKLPLALKTTLHQGVLFLTMFYYINSTLVRNLKRYVLMVMQFWSTCQRCTLPPCLPALLPKLWCYLPRRGEQVTQTSKWQLFPLLPPAYENVLLSPFKRLDCFFPQDSPVLQLVHVSRSFVFLPLSALHPLVNWCYMYKRFIVYSETDILRLAVLYSPKSVAAVLERVCCQSHMCSVLVLVLTRLCLSDGDSVSLSWERLEAPSLL